MNLKKELKNLIKGEVLDDEKTLSTYSRDASLFEVRPRVVVSPKDEEDLKKLVLFVNQHKEEKLSLTPRSAGTDMSGGPLNESIIVDFMKHFNNIKSIGKDYGIVQPGVFYRDFEKETLKHNLLLQSFPASREICAVGGMVGNSGGGENSLKYGKTEKFVRELKVVLSDGNEYVLKPLKKVELQKKMAQKNWEGELYRRVFKLVDDNYEVIKKAKPKVSKNSAGYALWGVWDKETFDLTKLFVGSQGTLGMVSEITFGLLRPKKHSALLVIFLKDLSPLPTIVERVLQQDPESFESYDDETLKLVLRFLPGFVKLMKGNLITLGLQFLPEFKMILFGGVPKLIMFAEFTSDDEEEAKQQAKDALESLKDLNLNMRCTRNEREVQKYFTIRRESFSLLRNHVKGQRTAPFIDDFVIKPEYLPEFFPKLWKILHPYKKYMTHTIAGHVGDGNFHIIPLMDMTKPKSKEIIPELMEKVHKLVFQYHGSITGEHNDGLIRSPYLQDMYGKNVYKLFEQVKDIFDPDNIFNPGKKVYSSKKYAFDHILASND